MGNGKVVIIGGIAAGTAAAAKCRRQDEDLEIIVYEKDKYSEIIESVLASYKKVKDFTEKEIDLIRKVVSEQKEVSSK